MSEKLKCSWIQILWIMLISLVCLLTFVSGKISYKQFLSNEITEIGKAALIKPQDGTAVKDGGYVITEDMAVFSYKLPVVGSYKFLEVEIQDLSVDELPVLYYGEYKGNQKDVQNFVLRNGSNYIYLGEKKIDKIVMAIGGEKEAAFSIKKIKLDENVPRISAKKSLVLYVLIFCVVFVLFGGTKAALGYACRALWIRPKGNVMQAYGNIVENCVFSGHRRFSIGQKQKTYLCRGIFGLLIAYMLVISEAVQLTKEYYPWHVLVICGLLILQCFLYYEKDGRRAAWDMKICVPFLCLAVWICIANGMAYKSMYAGVGWFMLLVVLLFGYSVSTVSRLSVVLMDISCAMFGTYPLVLLFSALLRPIEKGMIYTGIFRTPEYFAEYLILLLVSIQFIYKEPESEKKNKIILCIGLVSTEIFLIGTQQWLYVLVSIGSLLCWKKFQYKDKASVKNILISFVSAACIVVVVQNFSAWIHFDEIWKNDQLQPGIDFRNGGIQNVYQNFCIRFQQHCRIWRAYLRKMNVFGHDASMALAGKRVRPDNVWVSIIYKYGVFGFAFYLILTVRCLYAGFCRWKRERGSAEFFLLEIQVVCCILGCCSDFEMPFVAFLWVMFYLAIGFYLTERV